MALPDTGFITTDMIMQELGVAVQYRDWATMWSLARVDSKPKNKANAGGPYVFPDDWYGYSHIPPGDNIPPNPFSMFAGATTLFSTSMTWQMNGDNVAVVGYRVYRNGNNIASLGVVGNYTDNGLIPGTSYSYYIQAFDAAGNTTDCAAISIATVADTVPPNPFDLYGGPQYLDKIAFGWDNTKGDNVAVVGFRVYKNSVLMGTYSPSTSTYTETGLPYGTQYYYTVQAFDAAGNVRDVSSYFSTAQDTTPPGPFNLSGLGTTETTVSLSWTASSDLNGIAKYVVVRDAGGAGITRIPVAGNVLSYIDTGLQNSYLYIYHIEAEDPVGNSTSSNTIQMATVNPGPGIPISISSGSTESTTICNRVASNTIYATASHIVAGMIMYSDSHLTIPFNGGGRWFKNLNNNTRMFIQSSGVVGAPVSCP